MAHGPHPADGWRIRMPSECYVIDASRHDEYFLRVIVPLRSRVRSVDLPDEARQTRVITVIRVDSECQLPHRPAAAVDIFPIPTVVGFQWIKVRLR